MRFSLIKWLVPVVASAIVASFQPGARLAAAGPDFEDLGLAAESSWKGADGSGGFTSDGLSFNNYYDTNWGSWGGWAYSSITDNTTPGWGNQLSAITGSGVAGSSTYGVAYHDPWTPTVPTITIPADSDVPDGLFVTNTTYAYFSMKDGDDFVDPFTDGDWQKLTITGKDDGAAVGSVDFDLATGSNIVDRWSWLDLSGLQGQGVDTLEFLFSGSQADFVPSYVAIDAVPEPSTIAMLVSATLCLIFWLRRRRR